MPEYWKIVYLITFLVHFLLLLGVDQLLQGHTLLIWLILAAALAATYGCLCLLPSLLWMQNPVIAFLWLILVSVVAFGCSDVTIRCAVIYIALSLIYAGISQTGQMDERSLLTVSVLGLTVHFVMAPRLSSGQNYIPVELTYGKMKLNLTALRDTGNQLRDPLTGKPVLVVDAATAHKLTGLTSQQLNSPIETIGTIPGLRLIPYKVVGGSGLLLAMSIPQVKIGKRSGSGVVAFAPDILHANGHYQALTGGML